MPSVRIWTLESDNDDKVVKCLAEKLVEHLHLENISVRTASKKDVPKGRDKGLTIATQNYLKQEDYVIFVIDHDGPMSRHQRGQESNSLLNQIKRIVNNHSFVGKVFFAPAIQELEAWLLIDCLGIFCYFASRYSQYRNNCRDKVSANQSFVRLLRHYQKGNTEHIVETEVGGNGPKEYLEDFSEQVLRALNPNMPQKNINRDRYHERVSPDLAKYVVIDKETLRRNNSLRELEDVLVQFK